MAWSTTFNPAIEHPGGCYTCAHFGHRVGAAVWCARAGGEHVRSQAERGCAFWEREPGADDNLPIPSRARTVSAGRMRRLESSTPKA